MERATPTGLSQTWERAVHDPDAVSALGASRVLFKEISNWQSELVAEAVRGGATWEDVGEALGTTRQAAWARFRAVAEQIEGRSSPMADQIEEVKGRFREEVNSLRTELKRLDAKWKQERGEAQRLLRELERRRADDRKAFQGQVRDAAAKLREEIRRLKGQATAD